MNTRSPEQIAADVIGDTDTTTMYVNGRWVRIVDVITDAIIAALNEQSAQQRDAETLLLAQHRSSLDTGEWACTCGHPLEANAGEWVKPARVTANGTPIPDGVTVIGFRQAEHQAEMLAEARAAQAVTSAG
ncbi:hypothetical protein [Agromyces humi]|uniref:hypothetical protein n=1 Tax=Agromyces humi TaxID=1766800 RepID=UPI00135B34B7|nr:hypothetical protein [Agromyces humi]